MFITGSKEGGGLWLAEEELLDDDDRVEDDEGDPHDGPHRPDDVQDLFLHSGSFPEALI